MVFWLGNEKLEIGDNHVVEYCIGLLAVFVVDVKLMPPDYNFVDSNLNMVVIVEELNVAAVDVDADADVDVDVHRRADRDFDAEVKALKFVDGVVNFVDRIGMNNFEGYYWAETGNYIPLVQV
ncbi:hypothetical protein WICMUC_002132 [Wickerhamomyces mucosus]|uniref:Uncharacterized protein n=1 Tax=Wickerhamomyces mucosus TaxID=1378264 RepID=A0A9P8PRD0_9ASCO|nr:hypothetical protein WICMUC_002132 [Wickerhamomyces mucosus]